MSGETVYRLISATALRDWRRLSSTRFFADQSAAGNIIATDEVPLAEVCLPEGLDSWAAALRHSRIPFVSYPFEWTFEMLRRAALLQLDLVLAALSEGISMKDASPYNVQFVGSRPVFIDLGSFEKWEPGEPWAGYLQFCKQYLNPLLLWRYRRVPFRPLLRGSIEGIPPSVARRLLRARDLLRPGVLKDVVLHAALLGAAAKTRIGVRQAIVDARLSRKTIVANLERLRRVVHGLSARSETSEWSEYESLLHYDQADSGAKRDFVREVCERTRPRLVWDLGCNTGQFSRICADLGAYVVALDADEGAIARLYSRLDAQRDDRILPLVVNLADPSTGLGWRGLERSALWDRGLPQLALSLALVHHLSISANIPLPEIVDWLAELSTAHVVEFVDRTDPMTQRLLLNKRERHESYDKRTFESLLAARFRTELKLELASGTRTLYALTR